MFLKFYDFCPDLPHWLKVCLRSEYNVLPISYRRCLICFLQNISQIVPVFLEKNSLKWFYHIRVWQPSWLTNHIQRPGRVAQSVEHLTCKSGVQGSIPGLATYFRFSFRFFKKGSCQLLAKVCARSTLIYACAEESLYKHNKHYFRQIKKTL